MPRYTSSAVLVLTHLLDERGKPNAESRVRADKAVELFKTCNLDTIITSGWSFDGKLSQPVAALMKDYIIQAHHIADSRILISPRSRDTVGDAVFSRVDVVAPLGIQNLHIVTSTYHLKRTQAIFEYVFNGSVSLHFHGVHIDVDTKTHEHEKNSLAVFQETFKGHSAKDVADLIQILAAKHPFYNGKVFPKLNP